MAGNDSQDAAESVVNLQAVDRHLEIVNAGGWYFSEAKQIGISVHATFCPVLTIAQWIFRRVNIGVSPR